MTSQSETMVHFDKVDTDTSFFVVDYTTGVPCGGRFVLVYREILAILND